jgi:hypothetical protein
MPDKPERPEVPDKPDIPDKPDKPEIPERPEIPDAATNAHELGDSDGAASELLFKAIQELPPDKTISLI